MSKERRETVAYYDKHAAIWSARNTNSFWHEKQFQKFVRYFRKGDRILDIGCAGGINVPLFLGIGRKLHYEGIDVSRAMLKLAKSRWPQLTFHYADVANKRTLPRKKYDGFWAAAVLMHVPEAQWPQMLENIERMMRPGAVGYVTLPQEGLNSASSRDRRHFIPFDRKKFGEVVAPRGWKMLTAGTLPIPRGGKPWLWFIVRIPN